MSVEYLATEAPPRRRPSWLIGAAVLLVVTAVAGSSWWADGVRRDANQSMADALMTAQDQARIGEGRVMSTLTYASPMIWSTTVPEAVRAGLRELVEQSAADASATLTAVAYEVSGLRILPWQSAQLAARDRVLDFIAAERVRFDQITPYAANIGEVLSEPGPLPDAAFAALRASGAV